MQSEIEEIVRRRTNFEAALLGTRAETQNFTDYIDYEQQLEKLRRLRSHRLSTSIVIIQIVDIFIEHQ